MSNLEGTLGLANMITIPADLLQRIQQHGQEHVFAWWDRLTDEQRQELLDQLHGIDLDLLHRLFAQRDRTFELPSRDRIAPVPVARLDPADQQTRARGEQALRRGEVAILVVAGGQGSRLGFEHPKGMFPIGPVSGKSLFQLHAEKVLARMRKTGVPIPFLVMTSHATHAETEAFFQEHHYFGLAPADVYFFRQGT